MERSESLRFLTSLVFAVIFLGLTDYGAGQDVRLVDGDNNSSGRVEYFFHGEWSTFYHSYFTQNDARVVCRMLGFEPNGIVHMFSTAFYGPGTGKVIMSRLSCKGTEQNISECNALRSTSTSHSYDVSITCAHTKVRLVDGDNQMSGRVEIFTKGAWSTICDSGFSVNDAKVICSMLGYGDTGIAKPFTGSEFGTGSGDVVLTSLGCRGNEVDLVQCTGSWGTTSRCTHRNDAGVNCGATGIRLVDGPSGRAGRVEIYHGGAWGTVCDTRHMFDRRNAMVVCRMLGYNSSLAIGYSNGFYGEGHGPVVTYNLGCDGSEKDIAACTSSGTWHTSSATTSHCPHSNDVGVNCDGRTKIRLEDGDSEQSGRVELFRNGHWGTLGSAGFDNHDLEVICRMMGYEYNAGSFFYKQPYYGTGIGEVVADNLQCDGMESDIGLCHGVRYWPSTSQSHNYDVGVNCDGVIQMRVADGPTNGTGRLEIYHGGHWGTVCDRNFDRLDLIVACKSLGYHNIPQSAYFHPAAYYGQGLGEVLVRDLACNGVEENLGKCPGTWPANYPTYCTHRNDVSVSCDGGFEQLRLANGTSMYEGRVEILHDGAWRSICANNFDRADAVVICRELAMQQPEHARAFVHSEYGRGTGKFLVSNLQCNGYEASIDQCKPQYLAPTSRCYPNQAAAVNCCPSCSGTNIIG